ncbi:MAG: DUF1351 domain-containing protein [Erysipelotrichaceae bacterium]|jgi:hypothetical protein
MSKTKFELVVSPIKQIPSLTSNIDELKSVLEVSLKKYQNLVVTEDAISDAKSDRANLNKLKKSIADERIAQKKLFLAPFEEFETKCKEVEKLINDTSSSIDVQIKAFDEMEKEAKRKEIDGIYAKNIGDYSKLIPLAKIYDSKWENKTFKLKDVEDAIKYIKESADIHLKQIEELGSEFTQQLKDKYFETLDITSVLVENTRLIQQKKYLEELKAKEEAEALKRKEIVEMPTMAEVIEEPTEEAIEVVETAEMVEMVFKVICTKEQLNKLGEYMRNNNIKYGRP